MLAFLTDEHITHVVAEQVHQKRPDIRIESVLRWRGGSLRNKADIRLCALATTIADMKRATTHTWSLPRP